MINSLGEATSSQNSSVFLDSQGGKNLVHTNVHKTFPWDDVLLIIPHPHKFCFVLFKSYFYQGTKKSQRGYKTCLLWVYYWRLNLTSTTTTQAGGNVTMPEHPNLKRQIHSVWLHISEWFTLSWLTGMMTVPDCSKLYIAMPKNMSRSCCVQHRHDAAPRQLHWGDQEFICQGDHKAKKCTHLYISEIPTLL